MNRFRGSSGMFLAVAVVATLSLASCASDRSEAGSKERSGTVMIEKKCPPDQYTGKAGSFCTFTKSSLAQFPAGSKVLYLQPADPANDVILTAPSGGADDKAFGRCVLPDTLNGLCSFYGGTGAFTDFHATLKVTHMGDVNWRWEGPYSFKR